LDLCILLRASGCIGVSGGLEVASDRLLQIIKKGVTVAQVAVVNKNFTEAGIMVHAYLMYGFPSQSAQETIDSLEMVRQMFVAGILQSGFWHQFALTAHSPVGLSPQEFGIVSSEAVGTFANNDVEFTDRHGADPTVFSDGLKKSLFNYMHGVCLQDNLQKWFEIKVPTTSIAKNYIQEVLDLHVANHLPSAKIIFIGNMPSVTFFTQSKKGLTRELATLVFETNTKSIAINLPQLQGQWLVDIIKQLHEGVPFTMNALMQHYAAAGLQDFDLFWYNKPMHKIAQVGLLVL
jgi:hypothetical protein